MCFQAEDGIRGLVRSRGLEMCIRDRGVSVAHRHHAARRGRSPRTRKVTSCAGAALEAVLEGGLQRRVVFDQKQLHAEACLLYTSDAADELLCVDLGGRRIM